MLVYRLKSETLLATGNTKEALAAVEQSRMLFRGMKTESGAEFYWNQEYALDVLQLGRARAALNDERGASSAYEEAQQIIAKLLRTCPTDNELIQARDNLLTLRKALGGRQS